MPDSRPRTYDVLGVVVKFLAFPGERSNRYCLCEGTLQPGQGVPPNSHPGDTESFYVIEGQVEFTIDGKTATHGPGSFVMIPDGALHAFEATGDTPARILVLNAPGEIHEAFFTKVGRPLPEGTSKAPPPDAPPDIPAIMAIAAEAGITFPPPPAP